MDALRPRLSFTAEWLPAALLLAGTVFVAVLMVRELRMAPRAVASGGESSPSVVGTVPADAVSVPALMLGGGHELRVGDAADQAFAVLNAAATQVSQSAERGPLGARDVRTYKLAGTTFIVMFEPFERNGALRVAAIYLR